MKYSNVCGSLFFASLLTLSACATLSSAGNNVLITQNANDVKDCKLLGSVSADPPFGLPDDWMIKLRNKTGELGGNRVLANSPGIGSVTGTAYSCQ